MKALRLGSETHSCRQRMLSQKFLMLRCTTTAGASDPNPKAGVGEDKGRVRKCLSAEVSSTFALDSHRARPNLSHRRIQHSISQCRSLTCDSGRSAAWVKQGAGSCGFPFTWPSHRRLASPLCFLNAGRSDLQVPPAPLPPHQTASPSHRPSADRTAPPQRHLRTRQQKQLGSFLRCAPLSPPSWRCFPWLPPSRRTLKVATLTSMGSEGMLREPGESDRRTRRGPERMDSVKADGVLAHRGRRDATDSSSPATTTTAPDASNTFLTVVPDNVTGDVTISNTAAAAPEATAAADRKSVV